MKQTLAMDWTILYSYIWLQSELKTLFIHKLLFPFTAMDKKIVENVNEELINMDW